MPSVLHWQTKNIRHGWSCREIQTKIRYVIYVLIVSFTKKAAWLPFFISQLYFLSLQNAKLLIIYNSAKYAI